MTKLQVALDGTFEQAAAIMKEVAPFVQIAEIGTPLIYREGIRVAQYLHERFPNLCLLADLKIIDAGDEEASIAFATGCDYVTVMGVAGDRTVEGAVSAARRFGRKVVADMLQVGDPVKRAGELLALGCDVLCIHTAFDDREVASPMETLRLVRSALPDAPLAAAGGIRLDSLERLMPERPDIVVAGGAITRAANPAQVARAFGERM
ncbi:MAG: orotidine 5'-phosphate decarboxylase [Anaerolineae bacterium]|nr:orotidine 5'-phosphate decarboxylase [Anaerolineae bacterium]